MKLDTALNMKLNTALRAYVSLPALLLPMFYYLLHSLYLLTYSVEYEAQHSVESICVAPLLPQRYYYLCFTTYFYYLLYSLTCWQEALI